MLANMESASSQAAGEGQSSMHSPFFISVKSHAENFKAWTNTETIKDVKAYLYPFCLLLSERYQSLMMG